MALYNQLPVYKSSYDLLVHIFKYAKHFTKEYKYTIGESLKNETVDMITNIYRANSKNEKVALIQNARENVEVIRLYLRLIKDLQQINVRTFVALNEMIEGVSKQLTAWKKSCVIRQR